MNHQHLKIAYIGGGSRQWARKLMADLALDDTLSGEVRLYDIDFEAAQDNAKIGKLFQDHPKSESDWTYVAVPTLKDALVDVDFVIISILPATFKEMEIYTHFPEKYGIYQSVGDTTGPAGVMRALIAFPMFVGFAQAIKSYCPKAWVINFTNPMTMCLQALYEGFNEIKAYGNCHEVFGTQILLAEIYNEQSKEKKATKADIKITVSGINHFTWITQASCFGENMFPLYENFLKMNKNPEYEKEPDSWKEMYPFGSLGKVKYDLYDRFKCMAAAGDRHLAEFMPVSYYLKDETTRNKFKFHLTPVSFRIEQRKCAVEDTKKLICHEIDLEINESGEEGLSQLKALCGLKSLVTNINHINLGQALGLPKGQIVETNALFSYDKVEPIQAEKLPLPVEAMVKRHMEGHRMILESYRKKDLRYGLYALVNDPACGHLNFEEIQSLFDELVDKMGFYLDPYKQ